MVEIAAGDAAALAASFNVLDLVVGAAFAANGAHALAVPALTAQVPGLGGLYTQLTGGEPPKLACGEKGKATAQTGQVDLVVRGNIPDATQAVSGLTTALGPLG